MRQLILLLPLLAALGHSQTFEVASLRVSPPAPPGDRRTPPIIEPSPGNLVMRNVGMAELIMWAYKINRPQVANPQAIMEVNGRFDLVAKAAGPAKTDELRLMLQALLADRFKMKSHRESKETSVYVLVEAKGGHKLKPSESADGRGVLPVRQADKMALSGQSATLDQLGMFLAGPLDAPVLDMTGLKGRYDFEFDLTSFGVKGPPAPGEAPPDPVAVLQAALPKQLGLKLESRKIPVEVLVIDHLEKTPTDN